MSELKFSSEIESRSIVGDWALRGGVALFFFVFGGEKFSSASGSHWVSLFQEIGAGDWFRYLTGVIEILGGLLVLIPRIAIVGLALLASTLAAAFLILIFVLHRPADSIFPAIFFLAVVGLGWSQVLRARR